MKPEDLRLVLKDGRRVGRDTDGRYRDIGTGRWISTVEVEAELPVEVQVEPPAVPGDSNQLTLKDYLDNAVRQAALNQGHSVASLGEAWAKVLQVQTEIALDKEDPAKATAAARLLAKATNFMADLEPAVEEQPPWFILGRKLASEVLALVQEEQARRDQPREIHNELVPGSPDRAEG